MDNLNNRKSMELRLINRKVTRDGAVVVDIKVSNSSSKTPATTSLATNKKLVNLTSPAITTTTVEVDVAVAVINSKPPVSGTSQTVSILRERGAKNMARSSLQTMPPMRGGSRGSDRGGMSSTMRGGSQEFRGGSDRGRGMGRGGPRVDAPAYE